MQQPTCTKLRIRTTHDAHVIFHAVSLDLLHMVERRLDTEERRAISPGCVFVWEERGPNAEAAGLGIERWTDSIRWGPSRVRDEFLYYHEKNVTRPDRESTSDSETTPPRTAPNYGFFRSHLTKQTYSVLVETPGGRRKWHLIAYFTQDSLDSLRTINDLPQLASLTVPPGRYRTARTGRPNRAHHQGLDLSPSATGYLISKTSGPQFRYPSYGTEGSDAYATSDATMYTIPDDARSNRSEHHHNGNRSKSFNADNLAPLAYLQGIPPPRRHPLDEKALMSFSTEILRRIQ